MFCIQTNQVFPAIYLISSKSVSLCFCGLSLGTDNIVIPQPAVETLEQGVKYVRSRQ